MQVAADDCDEKTDIIDVPMEENKYKMDLFVKFLELMKILVPTKRCRSVLGVFRCPFQKLVMLAGTRSRFREHKSGASLTLH
ncbi:hypothetical protein P3S67_031663 [Capsicum chacoense]